MNRTERIETFRRLLTERILVIDGAMGTMIQNRKLTEADYRGERFKNWKCDLKGNSDVLVLTAPDTIRSIHAEYLQAGADIVETNTFTANFSSQADYGMEDLVGEINLAGARVARQAADEHYAKTGELKFVAGALGPTNRTASLSPSVTDPGFRNIDFDQLKDTYLIAARNLIEGGADPIYIARRLCILASEDIGLADPQAMVQAAAAADIVQLIGLPEGLFPLSQATIYLARAPKSNAIKSAYFAAAIDAEETARVPVPLHLRNAVTPLMKQVGYGKDYRYVHSDPAAKEEMECLPEQLRGRKYFSAEGLPEQEQRGETTASDD